MNKNKLLPILIFFIFTISLPITTFASEETEVNIHLKKGADEPIDKKEPIYTPKKPVDVTFLPQTSEILNSFIFIIIGLSILLFIIGIIMNKESLLNISLET